MSEQLDAALTLAGLGYALFPCHTIQGEFCSCGKRADDRRDHAPGKHPRTPHGFKDATTDCAVIREWWRKWPNAAVAVRTGKWENGGYLVVLDVDGDEGSDSLAELETEHGELPSTVTATTRRGQHYYFLSPREVRCSAGQAGRRPRCKRGGRLRGGPAR